MKTYHLTLTEKERRIIRNALQTWSAILTDDITIDERHRPNVSTADARAERDLTDALYVALSR